MRNKIVSKHFNFINGLLEKRYKTLLFSLILMILAPFFMEGSSFKDVISFVLRSATILLCIYCIHESKRQLTIGIVLATVVILINLSGVFVESATINFYLTFIIYILFYMFVIARLSKMIVNTENVRVGVLYAAVNVYLLIGVVGGYLFMLIENAIPGSLRNLNILNFNEPSEFFYFSFITLSTLGYGYISPISLPAEALSMILSTTGPLYLTVLVALLVSRFEHSDLHI